MAHVITALNISTIENIRCGREFYWLFMESFV